MLAVLLRRNFALLWSGQTISMIGDWVLFITLPFYVYQLTGSTLATGAMFLAMVLPRALFGSLAGVFVDRWNRKWTMISADLARAVLMLFLIFLHSREQIWLVYVIGALETTISLFFTPARNSLLPDLVEKEQLIAANSLDSISDNLTRILGPAIGGTLFALLGGFSSVAIIDSASYLFSALLIVLIRVPASAREYAVSETSNTKAISSAGEKWLAVWREWIEGLSIVKNDRIIWGIFLVMGLLVFGDGPLTVAITPFVKDILHGDSATLGLLMTVRGAGGLLGGFVTGWLGKYVRASYLIMIGMFGAGASIIVMVLFPSIPLTLTLLVIGGILIMFTLISVQTLLQQSVSEAYRGRIFGAYDTNASLVNAIGIAAASSLGDRVGIIPITTVAGVIYIIGGLAALVSLRGATIQLTPKLAPVPAAEVKAD
jgi:MFS family permease